jgi:hypothetical protein
MKKTICFIVLLVALINIVSCSNDDSSNNQPPIVSKTIQKIEEKIYYNGEVDFQYFMNFNYDNNILTSISDDTRKLEFIYEGTKIVEIKRYLNNQYSDSNLLLYEGNLLKTIIQDDQEEQTTFNYQNGVLSSKVNSYNQNGNWITFMSENYQFENNNRVQVISQNQFSIQPYKNTFEFDSKNSIMKNMNPYLKYIFNFETCEITSQNNAVKGFSYDNVNSNQATHFKDFEIIYDADDYPTSIKKYNIYGTQQELISEMTITYN